MSRKRLDQRDVGAVNAMAKQPPLPDTDASLDDHYVGGIAGAGQKVCGQFGVDFGDADHVVSPSLMNALCTVHRRQSTGKCTVHHFSEVRMTDRFPACLAFTLAQEGGFVQHPADPGGATNKGITLATYRQWVPYASVETLRAIPDSDVARIYRGGYWAPIRADVLPPGVDLMCFDFAVNAGPGRSAKMLQRAAGVAEDGAIGPVTLAAVRAIPAAEMVRLLSDLQRTYYATLANFGFFGRGWLARTERRVAKALESATARE